jgi:hypothetical protein
VRAAFIARLSGIDVDTDRATAHRKLQSTASSVIK